MFSKKKALKSKWFFLIFFFLSFQVIADSFDFNTYNRHGIVGLINTPTARFYDEGVHGITVYGSDIDQKLH